MYLIKFRYEHYCQGYEWAWTTVLVKAETFEKACDKIKSQTNKYYNATNFSNETIQ